MASVFLSYDHDDAALSKPLISALEKAGHTVWFDRHIHGGAEYSRKIEQALDEADAVVVLGVPAPSNPPGFATKRRKGAIAANSFP